MNGSVCVCVYAFAFAMMGGNLTDTCIYGNKQHYTHTRAVRKISLPENYRKMFENIAVDVCVRHSHV